MGVLGRHEKPMSDFDLITGSIRFVASAFHGWGDSQWAPGNCQQFLSCFVGVLLPDSSVNGEVDEFTALGCGLPQAAGISFVGRQ